MIDLVDSVIFASVFKDALKSVLRCSKRTAIHGFLLSVLVFLGVERAEKFTTRCFRKLSDDSTLLALMPSRRLLRDSYRRFSIKVLMVLLDH